MKPPILGQKKNFGCFPMGRDGQINLFWVGVSMGGSSIGGSQQPWGFPTKNDHFGVFWGYHHLRKPPYTIKDDHPQLEGVEKNDSARVTFKRGVAYTSFLWKS